METQLSNVEIQERLDGEAFKRARLQRQAEEEAAREAQGAFYGAAVGDGSETKTVLPAVRIVITGVDMSFEAITAIVLKAFLAAALIGLSFGVVWFGLRLLFGLLAVQ